MERIANAVRTYVYICIDLCMYICIYIYILRLPIKQQHVTQRGPADGRSKKIIAQPWLLMAHARLGTAFDGSLVSPVAERG